MTDAPTLYPTLLYKNAKAAIAQLEEAFGFTRTAMYEAEDGSVAHAEVSYGNGAVMVGSKGKDGVFSEAMRGAGTVGVYVVVQDVDSHCERAREAGAEILTEPTDKEYGARDYMARDLEGNVWSFGTYAPELGG